AGCADSDASRAAGWKGAAPTAHWQLPRPGPPPAAAGSPAPAVSGVPPTYGAGDVVDIAYDPEQRVLYTSSRTGSVVEYDLRSHGKLRDWSLGSVLSGIDLSPDRRTLLIAAATATANAYVHRIDLASGSSSKLLLSGLAGQTYSVAFVDADRALVSVVGSGASAPMPLYMLWVADGQTEAREISGAYALLVRSADRSVVAYAQTGSNAFGYYDIAADRFLEGRRDATLVAQWIAVNRDGTQLALLSNDRLLIADRDGAPRNTLAKNAGLQPVAAAFDPAGEVGFIAWGSSNGLPGQIELFSASFSERMAVLDANLPQLEAGTRGYGGRIEITDDGRYLFAITSRGVLAYPLAP
ncbi:MAG TPA: hypothetical protein VJR89_37640, partial [Polyangiales bacterium]|nr:hypothetical protein [Polyangiales bacterium]